MKDDSSEEYSNPEGLTAIVKALYKLKNIKSKSKVSSIESSRNQSKAKDGNSIAKLMKIINKV